MQGLWRALKSGSFDSMAIAVSNLSAEGYPAGALLAQLQGHILGQGAEAGVGDLALADVDKALICEKIAQVSRYLLSNPYFETGLLVKSSHILLISQLCFSYCISIGFVSSYICLYRWRSVYRTERPSLYRFVIWLPL